ncbi:MAG: PQQ-binding-like beta-propeller repeat protein [Nitrospirae bacterium]|nr:PQQ-binding-like beta-propeller repeat protein [Nitrospirota bacterium]
MGSDGTIYVSGNARVNAFNSSGTQLWQSDAGTAGSLTPALSSSGIIYVGTASDGMLYAIDATTGKTKWSYQTGINPDYSSDIHNPKYGVLTAPVIGADGTVYVGAIDGNMYALKSDGTLLWTYSAGSRITENCPAIGPDGTLYFSTSSGYLFAVKSNSATCSYTLSSSSQTVGYSGGAGNISVTPSSSSCAWTAASNASWITLTAGSSGTGSSTVSYSVSANTSGSSRTGTITAAGQTFTITESAASGSISHALTGPSNTTVSRGGTFGPVASSITNNYSSSYSLYLYASVYTPKGSWVDTIYVPVALSAGQTVSKNDIMRLIPSLADAGAYYFCEYLYDTSWNGIDHQCVEFTVQ